LLRRLLVGIAGQVQAMTPLDSTHDARLRSWVPSANDPGTDFPIQNLPFGRFRRRGTNESWRIGVAIGTQVLDMMSAFEQCDWESEIAHLLAPLAVGNLNSFMAEESRSRRCLRHALSMALREGSVQEAQLKGCLVPQEKIELSVPCQIGDYTDFYTGIHHATSVGKQFRPDNPLLPNYTWVPIGYHGRTSSIVPSGSVIRRPNGQTKAADAPQPTFGPTRRFDYELELGFFIARGNALGEPIPIARAEDHVFGVSLLNDWSARDIQAWEYQPLGPFLSKNFATTLSPWLVTMDALAPFRAPLRRPESDPEPLPYLDSPDVRAAGALDIKLEVWLQSRAMRDKNLSAIRLSSSSSRDSAYWTVGQLIAHHTCGGCNLQSGDLFGSGTLSGPSPHEAGSLLELTFGGKESIRLPSGEFRTFLEDGDSLTLRAWCEREGARRIGFGACSGTVEPAK
jgi:fumarylacetoacetase